MSGYAERSEHYALEFGTNEDYDLLREVIPDRGLILDVPCGAGRLLDLYSKVANDVVMVDVEPRMTAKCMHRAEALGLARRVSTLAADMRILRMDRRPAAVLVSHGGLQMLASLADVTQALETLVGLATPGAILYIDVADPWGVDVDNIGLLPPFMSTHEGSSGEQQFRNERITMRRRWHSMLHNESLEVQFSYRIAEKGHGVTQKVATSRWLRVRPEILQSELERLGVEVSAVLGHYDGRVYTPGSPRCITIGRV